MGETALVWGLVAPAHTNPQVKGDHVARAVLLDDEAHPVRENLAQRSGQPGLGEDGWADGDAASKADHRQRQQRETHWTAAARHWNEAYQTSRTLSTEGGASGRPEGRCQRYGFRTLPRRTQ